MVGWARSFWDQNWHLTGCLLEEQLDAAWAEPDPELQSPVTAAPLPEPDTAAMKRLDQEVGGVRGQEFQEVNLDATFAGISLRQMANGCGLGDLYRYLFQTASGVTRGEWWAIEDYAMQRCMNPLHLFHRIPSNEVQFPITPDFAGGLISHFKQLMTLGVRTLGCSAQRSDPDDPKPDRPVADDPEPGEDAS